MKLGLLISILQTSTQMTIKHKHELWTQYTALVDQSLACI